MSKAANVAMGLTRGIYMPPLTKRDALLFSALFIFNCFAFSAWLKLAQVPTEPWLLLAWLYGLFGLVPLAWRDEAPGIVFATQWVLTVAAWPFMSDYIPMAGLTVALYAVAVHYGRRTALLTLLVSCVPVGLELAAEFRPSAGDGPYASFVTNGVIIVVAAGCAWGLGRMTQASQRRVQELEYERESAREAAVLATERRRIARELHDIVSHAVTVIVLQAAGAARVGKTDFTQVIRSLTHIETTGKQAMAELRRLLGVLEDSSAGSRPAGTGDLKPQPGLADLPELLTSFNDVGIPVIVDTEGTAATLDSSIDLTAYRIVQEGLVNAVKHAGKNANPRLRLTWRTQGLRIQIDNDITIARTHRAAPLPDSGGRGLVGLRERAHAVGGDLQAGPHEGGYRLTATIPFATPGVSAVSRASLREREDQGTVST